MTEDLSGGYVRYSDALRILYERDACDQLAILAQRYRDADPGPAGASLADWLKYRLERVGDDGNL